MTQKCERFALELTIEHEHWLYHALNWFWKNRFLSSQEELRLEILILYKVYFTLKKCIRHRRTQTYVTLVASFNLLKPREAKLQEISWVATFLRDSNSNASYVRTADRRSKNKNPWVWLIASSAHALLFQPMRNEYGPDVSEWWVGKRETIRCTRHRTHKRSSLAGGSAWTQDEMSHTQAFCFLTAYQCPY